MLQSEKEIKTLTDMGLTVLQAKTYLTLVKLGPSSIKNASKNANVARQSVYQVIPSLQKKGLVEKIMCAPTIYKAVPIKEGMAILLQNKTDEYADLQKKARLMLEGFHGDEISSLQDEEAQFVVSSEGGLVLKRLENQIYTAKKSIDTVSTWRCCGGMLYHYASEIKKVTAKGVRFRALTDNENREENALKFLHTLQNNPLFEIRYTALPIQIRMTIADQKEVNLCISTAANRGIPNLWSNNPNFATLATGCFEEMWKEATPKK